MNNKSENIIEVSNKIIIIQKSNLLDLADEGHFDVILHGCNCFNTMGAGIAGQIKNRYPEAFFADEQFHRLTLNKKTMMGFYSYCTVKTKSEDFRSSFMIFNLYTQYECGANFDLDSFVNAMERIDRNFRNKNIGLPWIGCGIGGLKDEKIIINILKKLKNNYYHVVEL